MQKAPPFGRCFLHGGRDLKIQMELSGGQFQPPVQKLVATLISSIPLGSV